MNVMKVMKRKAAKVKKTVPASLWFAQARKSKWEMLPPAQQHEIEHGIAPFKLKDRPKASKEVVRALTANISVQADQVEVSVTTVAGELVTKTCFGMQDTTLDLETSMCKSTPGRFTAILDDDGSKVLRGDHLKNHGRLTIKIASSKDKPEQGSGVRKFRWKPGPGEEWALYRLMKNGRQAVRESGGNSNSDKRAFKAPRINLKKFRVTINSEKRKSGQKTITTYKWRPSKVKGVCFSPITYGSGTLELT